MRPVSPELAAHLAGEVTSLATCWRLQRRDGVLVTLTSHDRDIEVAGEVYRASGGLTATSVQDTADLAVDNLEVDGVLGSAGLAAADLAAGRFDGARVDLFLVNWAAPGQGSLLLKRGTLGRVSQEDAAFRAEIRGLTQALQRPATEVYSPDCRAELGDSRCKRSLSGFERDAEVDAVVDAMTFTAAALTEPASWYAFGRIRWHLGANAGLVSEVRHFSAGEVTLLQPTPQPVAAGDVFTITAGCDKRLSTCRTKFDNVLNFRGDPFVPGTDAVLDYPGRR